MIKKIVFSGFYDGKSKKKDWETSLDRLALKIKTSEKLKEVTKELRDIYAQLQKAKKRMCELINRPVDDTEKSESENEVNGLNKSYRDKKSSELPLITVHAYFPEGRTNNDPHTYYNIILTDIDHISGEQIDELLPKIKEQPYVILACRSVSGEGLHILTCVEVEGGITDENFKDVFRVTTQLIESDLNITADKCVNSISRCMFLNYDENVYYNPDAIPLDITKALWIEKKLFDKLVIDEGRDEQQNLSKYLDAADTKLNWTVGSRHTTLVSLASTCNRAGFSESDLISECCRRYSQSSFPDEEIRETISDVYNRYSSDHGINRKPEYVPQKDKGTKGQIDTSKETEKEFLDPEEELKALCPDVAAVRKYIPKDFYDYMIDFTKSALIRFVELMGLLVSAGAMMQDVKYWMQGTEFAYTFLYFILVGPAASGKGCISKAYKFFQLYANDIQNESSEEVRKAKEAHKIWEKCVSKCKEEDCGCGAEPVVPREKKLGLSLNISPSKLVSQLADNGDFPALSYDSELDAMMNMKEWPLAWMLRCISENETIRMITQTRGYVEKEKPKMGMLAAGTGGRFHAYLKTKKMVLPVVCCV